MDIFWGLVLQLVLILINAFFAATEIAVISLNEKKVRALAEDGDKKAKKMLKIIESPTNFLSTIQIGITLAGFLGSAFAADNFAQRLSSFAIRQFGISASLAGTIQTISVILITLILSYFTLVLGELVPKRIAMRNKEKFAEKVCGIILFLAKVLKPIIWLLSVSTNGVLRLLGINPHEKEEAVSEEDIVVMLDAGGDEGTLDKENIKYIKNVFKLDGLVAEDIMTPRKNLVAISENATKEEILSLIENEGYSRIPVFSDDDNITSICYVKEFLVKYNSPDFDLKSILKPATFVPEKKHLDVLFKEMRQDHNHIVVVVDEYGMTTGIVTMEDIIEELVGEIYDEQDEAINLITKIDDDNFTVNTSISIEDFFEQFNLDREETIESTTLNGWIIERLGDIPDMGTEFEYQNIKIKITKVNQLQTEEVIVTKLKNDEAETENDDE